MGNGLAVTPVAEGLEVTVHPPPPPSITHTKIARHRITPTTKGALVLDETPASAPDDEPRSPGGVEASAELREAILDTFWGDALTRDDLDFHDGVERLLARFELRPRGTVTDAEVEAGAQALYAADPILYALPEWREKIGTPKPWSALNEGTRNVYRKRARPVLEAARDTQR